LDIRDSLNWLEPELYLDPEELRKKLAEASTSPLSALDGWTLETDPGKTVVLANSWNEYDREDPRYRVLLGSPGPFLSLTKTMDVGAEDRWLVLAAHRPHDKAPGAVVQIQIDGVALAELEVPPARDALGPDPLLIPIESYRGKTVEVRLIQFSKTQSNPAKASEIGFVDWTGITTSPHRPGLLPLLVESKEFLEQFNDGDGGISLDRETKFSGDASVKITPPERSQASLSNLSAAIRALPQLGEYRLISFAWKKQGGHEIALGLGHHGKLGGEGFGKGRPRIRRDPAKIQRPKVRARKELESVGRGLPYGYRYLRGRSNPDVGSAMMLDRKIPEDWQRVERDLFTDFGEFTLTGLSLTAFDGEAAWFDEVYLARSHRDLHDLPSRIPETKPPNDPNLLALTSSREQMGQVAGSGLGPFAVAEFGDRVWRFKEYQGKTNVIRTRPRDQKTPAVLRGALQLPKSKNSRLELEVHRHQQGDWKLVVQANGERIHEAMIDKNRAGETWHQASIDLSRFAGQAVLLEIHNAANNWQNEEAYWGRVEIVADP